MAGRSSPDDWAAALKLLQVSVERDISPSRATLYEDDNSMPDISSLPKFQNGNAPPPPPPSLQAMLFGGSGDGGVGSSSHGGSASAIQTESLSVQQLFGSATSQLHKIDSPATSSIRADHSSPRANNMISLSSIEQSIANQTSSGAPPPPPSRIAPSAPTQSNATTLDKNTNVDDRAVPMLFGQNQQNAVMSNWLGGMLGGPAATPVNTSTQNNGATLNGNKSQVSSKTSSKSTNKIGKQTLPYPSQNGQKLLLLLDMNGTLLLRLKGRLGNVPPAFTHAGLNYFIRDGVHELVRELRSHPRCELAFYTSMRESNALPAVKHITGGEVIEVYDRDYNKADNTREDAKDWDTMRDLDKVWANRGKRGYGFGHSSTVMIDDSERKMRHAPLNLVKVPEFKEKHHIDDGSMAKLLKYLLDLLNNCEGDVREYIRDTQPEY